MSLPEPRHHEAREARIITIRFRMKASADHVVARLLEAVRPIDVSLLKVFGDGNRLYPFDGSNPTRTACRGAQNSTGERAPDWRTC